MNQLAGTNVVVHHGLGSVALGAGHFVLHFLEMVIAMMVGMGVFLPVKGAFVSQGYTALLDRASPDYWAWMGAFMVIPMVLWMRFRGCGWRLGVEMAIGMLLPAVAVLLLCDVAHVTWLTPGAAHPAMLIGMLAAMIYRHEHYSSYSLKRWRACDLTYQTRNLKPV